MNNCNYKFLWLDDVSKAEEIQEAKECFPNLEIIYVPFIDKCQEELELHSNEYDAVIFDANNQRSSSPGTPETASTKGFIALVEDTLKKKIPVYIYSGELNPQREGDNADNILDLLDRLGLKKQKHIFEKTLDIEGLFTRIILDLKSSNHLYIGREYLLDFFKKGWIEKKYKSQYLDPLMSYYNIYGNKHDNKHDCDSAHGNHMRNFTEQILERVNKTLEITDLPMKTESRWNTIVKQLSEHYSSYAPLMEGALTHMIHMSNDESHYAMNEEDRELFFDSDFATFFLVTKWFDNLMKQCIKEGVVVESSDIEKVLSPEIKTEDTTLPPKVTREESRPGMYVHTYQMNGRTYFDAKIEVKFSPFVKNRNKDAYVTGIKLNYQRNGWETFKVDKCEESENPYQPESSGFKLSDTVIFKKWKKK